MNSNTKTFLLAIASSLGLMLAAFVVWINSHTDAVVPPPEPTPEPPPVVVDPPPVVEPPPPPPVEHPPVVTPPVDSPDGTIAEAPSGTVRVGGHLWSFGEPEYSGWKTVVDGTVVPGYGFRYLVHGGKLYVLGGNQIDWYRRDGDGWVNNGPGQPGTTPPPLPPPPPPPPTPEPPPPPVAATEFTLTTLGATQVVVGHDLYFVVWGTRPTGNAENTYIRVLGDWSGVFPDLQRTCCGDDSNRFMWQVDGSLSTSVRISVPATLAPGNYSAVVEIKNSRVQQTVAHAFTVVAVPVDPSPTFGTLGEVPALAQYKEQMLTKGRAQLGNRDNVLATGLWEGNAWYYDGTRVAYQIADYTEDPSWSEFAKNPLDVYRPYVLDNGGRLPGWRVFPQGLRMHYERTGDVQSKQAAIDLLNASYGPNGIITKDLIQEGLSREVAYAIDAMLESEKLGQARHPRLTEYVDIALGHIDLWFRQEKFDRMAPFMFALTSEALIKWHEATGDTRVLPALKVGADWIWAKTWVPDNKSFVYEYLAGNTLAAAGSPDLNLLIAPVYGWVYRKSGDATYIDKGDQVFAGGVAGAWLDQGKQFSQSYRWSLDYLKWRNGN